MIKPDNTIEIFLQPGDFYFGDRYTRIRTLLGSCIAITIWHPKLLIGGMCHFMLPSRSVKRAVQLDGRYGDEAIQMFLNEVTRHRTKPNEYIVKIFGGSKMFHHSRADISCTYNLCTDMTQSCDNIACRNIIKGLGVLEDFGFVIASRDLGGRFSRHVILDIWSGDVWLRKNNSNT